jgi:hypothetical protein
MMEYWNVGIFDFKSSGAPFPCDAEIHLGFYRINAQLVQVI